MNWRSRWQADADAAWRTLDRLASAAMVLASAAVLVGAGLLVWPGGQLAADPLTTGSATVDQQPVAELLLASLGTTVKGHDSAQLAIIEFSDFQCPYCARYATGTHARIEHDYVDTGRIKYAFRNMPLDRIHPQAQGAAEAAACAGRQDRFWDMYDRLFAHQSLLGRADLVGHAKGIGLDQRRFARCLEGETAGQVAADRAEAARLAISSTPTFLIGELSGQGEMRVRRRVKGTYPPDVFAAIFDELLEGPPQ
jgi:protein-disulfide isomerase